ncbi:MAG: DUF433 domain-containing protein [Candidatus Hydrogenedentes bacterium]|nr:DUF433 domain-containing protein [Candidatus Hydrogenedentota bacterium]
MAFVAQAEAPPLREEADGALRVGQTRVLLELVIHAFQRGESPETIVESYPSLALADVYSVIGYYLHHQETIAAYLQLRERQAEDVRRRLDAIQPDASGLRTRINARRRAE